jgi:hypothetical protein
MLTVQLLTVAFVAIFCLALFSGRADPRAGG